MIKWNVVYYSLLLLFYLVFGIIIVSILVLIFGVADFYLILTFGLLNTLLSNLFYKINFFKSILIGFFISSAGYLSSYVLLIFLLILNFNTSSYILILPLLFNVFAQTFLWIPIDSIKKFNVRNISIMAIATVIALFVSLNLWDYWRYEHIYKFHHKVPLTIQLFDSETGQVLVGDTIELIDQRQPLYGIMQFPSFAKNVTDQKGLVTFEIYNGNYYDGSILNKKEYFKIHENKEIEKDTIRIEVPIQDDCKNC